VSDSLSLIQRVYRVKANIKVVLGPLKLPFKTVDITVPWPFDYDPKAVDLINRTNYAQFTRFIALEDVTIERLK
jgi:hypothetical protein